MNRVTATSTGTSPLPIASALVNGVQVPIAESAAALTPAQVCDLPMGELLARVNGRLDATEINEPKFFGYVTVSASGRIVIYIPTQASDLEREIAIRFLVTKHLGLSTHLFPDVLQVTVFDRNGEVQA